MTTENGMSLFESLVILSTVRSSPGTMKGGVAQAVRAKLGMDICENTVVLHMIDNLVRTGLLVRLDFKYHLTPAGERYLTETRERFLPAIRELSYR